MPSQVRGNRRLVILDKKMAARSYEIFDTVVDGHGKSKEIHKSYSVLEGWMVQIRDIRER
jgi:hypothetical protein